MMRTILSSAIFAAMLVPGVSYGQTSSHDKAANEAHLAADRAEVRAAEASKDPKRIAAAKARIEQDDATQWDIDHPARQAAITAEIRRADAAVEHDRMVTKAAYASKDPKRIAEAKAQARKDDAADWDARHRKNS